MKNKFKTLIKKIKRMGFRIKEEPKVNDPVCGMEITDDFISSEYKGIKYYFCSENCKTEFESNPNKFIV